MKNLLIITLSLVLTFCFQQLNAQQTKAGMLSVSTGAGVLPTFNKDDGKVKVLPLLVSADYQISKNFRMGLLYGYSKTEAEKMYLDSKKIRWQNNFSTISLRVIVNGGKWENWDVYGGFSINYNISALNILEGNDPEILETIGLNDNSTFSYTGLLGANYAINKKFVVFGELGYNISLATAGIKYYLTK